MSSLGRLRIDVWQEGANHPFLTPHHLSGFDFIPSRPQRYETACADVVLKLLLSSTATYVTGDAIPRKGMPVNACVPYRQLLLPSI